MDIDPKTLFWLAGLFEGEASFAYGIPSEPNNPHIYMRMTDEDVVRRVSSLFELNYTHIPPKEENWKDSYFFALKGARAVEVMSDIYPLMSKRRQNQIAQSLEKYIPKPNNRSKYSSRTKLTEDQVKLIKCRLGKGETAKSIAQDFDISHYAIWDIRSGKTWDYVSIAEEQPVKIDKKQSPLMFSGMLSDENCLLWLAGLLEGEGSFLRGMPSEPNTPRISVAMTDEDVIERIAKLCNINYHHLLPRNEGHKDVYRIIFRGKRAVELMKQLRPLMGKRRQGQIERALNSYTKKPPTRANAKITEAQAYEIKLRLKNGEKPSTIAVHFDVSESIVNEIKYGRTWKHIN
jgi:hypothetical protein